MKRFFTNFVRQNVMKWHIIHENREHEISTWSNFSMDININYAHFVHFTLDDFLLMDLDDKFAVVKRKVLFNLF